MYSVVHLWHTFIPLPLMEREAVDIIQEDSIPTRQHDEEARMGDVDDMDSLRTALRRANQPCHLLPPKPGERTLRK